MDWLACIVIVLVIILSLLVLDWNSGRREKFWTRRGVARIHRPHWPIIGNWWSVITARTSQGMYFTKLYKEHNDAPMVGTFSLTNPVLLVRDPRLVDKIMATDFSHFVDRGLASDAQASPIDLGLVTMTGASWKAARQKLSPVFSSGKLKTMFEQVSLTAQAIIGYIEKAGGAEMNVKEITSMYSTDVTASCFFGLDVGATLGADNEFRRQALRAFDMTYPQFLKFLLTLNLPSWIGRRLGGSLTPPDLAAYFGDIIAHAIKARKENDIRRSDILQLLLDIREKGTVEPTRSATAVDPDDEYLAMGGNRENKESSGIYEFNDDSVAAHAYTFLTAGLDTSTLALCFCIMQLSLHQDVQEKARDEVRKVLGSKSWPTYLDLKAMSYLENCILETMRLYPAVAILFRQCTKDYTFEDGVTLKAGDSLVLPILGIHTDPNYFDDPMEYRPERHSESKFQRGTFFPFGDGPRICIGMRFAMITLKLALVGILLNYRIRPSPRTKLPIEYQPMGFTLIPKYPIYCSFTKL